MIPRQRFIDHPKIKTRFFKWFYTCLLSLFFFLPSIAQAQVYTGGSVGVSFLNNRTYIEASPIVGYRMGDLRTGVGGILSYIRRDGTSWTHYGTRLFSQYDIADGLFIHAEMEALNVDHSAGRDWVFSIPLGAGYSRRISNNMYATAMILFDVIRHEHSPYENPIIRGGIRYHL